MAEYVVVGGGVAATQAAETIRKLRRKDAVTLVAEEEHPFYLRPLLADFVAGRVEEGRLWRDFDSTAAAADIKLITGKKAAGIDRSQRVLVLDDGTRIRYDKLLVATGVKPRLPDVPGATLDRVTAFSQYADAVRIKQWAEDARTAVVIGRGLQGVELTRALRLLGLDVTMVVPDESPWFPALFQVKGDVIERKLEERGVKVIALDQPAEVIGSGGRALGIKTRRGDEIPADIVGFALDQRASVQFLVGSGISLADGVVVNSRLQSTDENVYAAGDVAQLEIEGVRKPLGYGWLRATQHGEAAGRNMTGETAEVQVGDETEAQALYGSSLLARWG